MKPNRAFYLFLIFSIFLLVSCSGKQSRKPTQPSYPDGCASLRNVGQWSLMWGQRERTFSYENAFAMIRSDGGLSIFFMSSDFSTYPLAIAYIPNIENVPTGLYSDCNLSIMFDSLLSEMAFSPCDPLQTQAKLTTKDVFDNGKISGEFRGNLASGAIPDMEKVSIIQAKFHDVCVKGGP